MEYKLKDDVDFKVVRKKALMKYDFDLADYYNEETRIFTFPKGYVAWHLMTEVFIDFLEPLDLVEKISEDISKEDKRIKRIEERESGWWPDMADGNVSTLKQAINEIIEVKW